MSSSAGRAAGPPPPLGDGVLKQPALPPPEEVFRMGCAPRSPAGLGSAMLLSSHIGISLRAQSPGSPRSHPRKRGRAAQALRWFNAPLIFAVPPKQRSSRRSLWDERPGKGDLPLAPRLSLSCVLPEIAP